MNQRSGSESITVNTCGKSTGLERLWAVKPNRWVWLHNKDVTISSVLNETKDPIYGIGSLRIQTEALLAFCWPIFLKDLLIWGVPVAKPEID